MSFEDDLLDRGNKWWEFLDDQNEAKDVPTPIQASTELLDWSGKFRLQERHGPVGFDFFERCAECGDPLPPDVTFCFHCGGAPVRSHGFTPFAIVIKELESKAALEEGAKMIAVAGEHFDIGDAKSVLKQLPAAFMVNAPKKQVVAFCGRLSDVGVYARAYKADAAPISWAREAVESVARNPVKLLGGIALIAALVVAGWFSTMMFWLSIPIVVFCALFFELRSYQERFQIDIVVGLDNASGFDAKRANDAKYYLQTIRHNEVRKKLTVCLMEYYALAQTLRGHQHSYGPILVNAASDLEELLGFVFGLCDRVVRFERAPDAVTLDQRLQYLAQKGPSAHAEEERLVILDQLKFARQGAVMIDRIVEELEKMNVSLESLRSRISRFQNDGQQIQQDADMMETILSSLGEELYIFAEAYEAIES